MSLISHQSAGGKFAEIVGDQQVVSNVEEASDLLGDLYYDQFDGIIFHQHHLTPDFFDLRNGMAGEILQKFSNLRVKLAVVGDFGAILPGSLKDLIRESNRGRQVVFVASVEEALLIF